MSSFPLTFIFFKMVIAPPTSDGWDWGIIPNHNYLDAPDQ